MFSSTGESSFTYFSFTGLPTFSFFSFIAFNGRSVDFAFPLNLFDFLPVDIFAVLLSGNYFLLVLFRSDDLFRR